MSSALLEEQILEAQVESMLQRIGQRRSHDDIQRDVRRDQFELAKVLRSQAVERGSATDADGSRSAAASGILSMARTLVGLEFAAVLPSSRPYAQSYGLRCLVRVVSGGKAARGAFSQLPQLDGSMRRLDDMAAALSGVAPPAHPVPSTSGATHSLRAAQDALAAWEDVSCGDVGQYLWGRALQHKSLGMTMSHTFLPPLPTPAVGLDKYVAYVVSAVVASPLFVSLPPCATHVINSGLNRAPNGTGSHPDGSLRLASDTDEGALSAWWPSSALPKKSKHFVLLVNGSMFSVDLASSGGRDLSMSELSSSVTAVFIAAQSSNARNTFTRCSTLTTDNLVDTTDDQASSAKAAYSALRAEVAQLVAHERQLGLLETARFAVSVDASLAMANVLADREVGSVIPPRSTYPSINRWPHNALNIGIDAGGAIEICVPSALTASTNLALQQAPWVDRLSAYLTNACITFDELASEEHGPAAVTRFLVQRCVWATGIVFRVVSNTPGKACLCFVLEQLAQYTAELQRLVPDAEERGALEAANRAFTAMVSPGKGAEHLAHALTLMNLFFQECEPFFRTLPHPVVRGPLNVEALDVEHTAFLTRALINPLISIEMRREDGTEYADPVLQAMTLLPPGTVKLVQLDAMEGFVSLKVDAPHIERIDFFSHLPTKEQRAEAIAAAGKIGFHIVHAQQALAAVEEAAKKSFQRLLYAHENSLDRHDPWRRGYRFSFDENVQGIPRAVSAVAAAATVSDTIVLQSEEVFKFSRRVSRFVIHNVPRQEDEALMLRFAHPASIVRAVAALATQFAQMHVQMPLQPRHADELAGLTCSVKAWDGVERLVSGDALPARDVLALYQQYFLPVLCASGKTAPMPKHRAVQLCADAIMALVEHVFEPVEAPHHMMWVGAVHRQRIIGHPSGETVPVDVTTFASALPRGPRRTDMPWHRHLDALDCVARCAPVHADTTPCVLTPLQTLVARSIRAPRLGIAFPPTENVNVNTGDDVRSALHSARTRRLHVLETPLTSMSGNSSAAMPTSLRLHVLAVKSQRFIDKKTMEEIRLDIRGVWSSDAFAVGFLESFQRCFQLLWGMWSVDNLDLAEADL